MLSQSPFAPEIVFHAGPVPVSRAVVTTWGIMAALSLLAWMGMRRRSLEPGGLQSMLEILVEAIDGQIREAVRRDTDRFLPLVGTLFLFLAVANVGSIVPGVVAPTAQIETPVALGLVVFLSVHVYGIRLRGLGGYLKGYLRPNPLLLPFNVLSEITRTFSLMVRLFGNIMSHELILGIVLGLAGFLVPIPLMALSILIGLVQAYIFSVLAAIFLGAAVAERDKQRERTPA